MPDPLRRISVHVIVLSLIIVALAPQTIAAPQPSVVAEHLLAMVETPTAAAASANRGTTSQRTAAAFNIVPASSADGEQFPSGGLDLPPSVAMSPTVVRTAAVQWVSRPGGAATVSGTASWYCCTRGWGDAAVVALPTALGGHYYAPPGGFSVVVCADRCARLPVGDACGCHWGQVGQKVIDLSPAAWAAITDKDRHVYGIVSVTVYLD